MISAKILLARQNVALTRPPDPQTFWMRKPCIGNPASAPRGAIYECAFAPYRRRGPQCSTGADGMSPDKYDDFAFRRPRLWFLIRPRAMRIPSVGAKASPHLRPIALPWTKTQAGKRL